MRKLFAILCGIIFVMLLVVTTLALSLRSFVFDANFYISTLKARGVLQQLEEDPLRFIDLTQQIPQLDAIPEQLQQQVVTTILPPGWLEKQVASVIPIWLEWFGAGEAGAPVIEIDLRQIKDRLQGPPGQQAASDVVNAIPTCTPDQQPQLSLTQLPECIPQVFDRNAIIEQVAQTLSDAASQMPNQYDVGPRLAPRARFGPLIDGRRVGLALLDTSLLLLVVSTIGVWVLGAMIGARNARERWSWFGRMLLVGSIAVLGVSLFLSLFGVALLPQAWLTNLAAEASAIVRGLMQAFMQQLAVRSLIAGGLWFVAAFVLLWVGLLRAVPAAGR